MCQTNEPIEAARIFLRNFIPVSQMDAALRAILDAQSGLRADLRVGNLDVIEETPNSRPLCKCPIPREPCVLLLILNGDLLENACQWLAEQPEPVREIPTIAVTDGLEPDQLQRLLDGGVSDFILAPFKPVDVVMRIQRCLEFTRRRQSPVHTLKEKLGLQRLIGNSPVFRQEIEKIPKLARCDASVLIAGETGTGKELCASAIHYLSARAGQPFIAINCAAILPELMENELFGHERGAYTGAVTDKRGIISEANGGTLFLDEIACVPVAAQAKLLRFLENKEYRALGSNKTVKANVRVIAATNIDFQAAIQTGQLRQDLYYRLDVLSLRLPSLRERSEDIPLLAHHFMHKYAKEFDNPVTAFSPGALRKLTQHHWPGNVRELEHVIEQAVALAETRMIRSHDLILRTTSSAPAFASSLTFHEAKAILVAQFERDYLQEMLRRTQGNITKAAQAGGIDRRSFFGLIHKHGIDARSFKTSSPPSERKSRAFLSRLLGQKHPGFN